jgi:hypothetical protein
LGPWLFRASGVGLPAAFSGSHTPVQDPDGKLALRVIVLRPEQVAPG